MRLNRRQFLVTSAATAICASQASAITSALSPPPRDLGVDIALKVWRGVQNDGLAEEVKPLEPKPHILKTSTEEQGYNQARCLHMHSMKFRELHLLRTFMARGGRPLEIFDAIGEGMDAINDPFQSYGSEFCNGRKTFFKDVLERWSRVDQITARMEHLQRDTLRVLNLYAATAETNAPFALDVMALHLTLPPRESHEISTDNNVFMFQPVYAGSHNTYGQFFTSSRVFERRDLDLVTALHAFFETGVMPQMEGLDADYKSILTQAENHFIGAYVRRQPACAHGPRIDLSRERNRKQKEMGRNWTAACDVVWKPEWIECITDASQELGPEKITKPFIDAALADYGYSFMRDLGIVYVEFLLNHPIQDSAAIVRAFADHGRHRGGFWPDPQHEHAQKIRVPRTINTAVQAAKIFNQAGMLLDAVADNVKPAIKEVARRLDRPAPRKEPALALAASRDMPMAPVGASEERVKVAAQPASP